MCPTYIGTQQTLQNCRCAHGYLLPGARIKHTKTYYTISIVKFVRILSFNSQSIQLTDFYYPARPIIHVYMPRKHAPHITHHFVSLHILLVLRNVPHIRRVVFASTSINRIVFYYWFFFLQQFGAENYFKEQKSFVVVIPAIRLWRNFRCTTSKRCIWQRCKSRRK